MWCRNGTNGKFITRYQSRNDFFLIFYKRKFHKCNIFSYKSFMFDYSISYTLNDTIVLLAIELYYLAESLIKRFLIFITCRMKIRFVLKRCSSDILTRKFFCYDIFFLVLLKFIVSSCNKKIFVQNCMINGFEYGIKIRSIHANFSFTQKNIASKKQVEKNFLNEAFVDKPILTRKYVVGCDSDLLKLRRKCNGFFPACF